jgi:hypothetical protein
MPLGRTCPNPKHHQLGCDRREPTLSLTVAVISSPLRLGRPPIEGAFPSPAGHNFIVILIGNADNRSHRVVEFN